mgnify:CR=1 FL=1
MISDIQMTEMTGLELIEAARKIVPELRVIVLTGYDNFEYARQSLRLQVQDFFSEAHRGGGACPGCEQAGELPGGAESGGKESEASPEDPGNRGTDRAGALYEKSGAQAEDKGQLLSNLKEYYHFDIES